MATGVVIINKDGIEPTNDVWAFTISGDPTTLGLACGLLSLAVRVDSIPAGQTYEKTTTPDTGWTLQTDAGALSAGQISALTGGGDTNLHFHSADRALAVATGVLPMVQVTSGTTSDGVVVTSATVPTAAQKTALTGGASTDASAQHGHAASAILSGVIPIARLATGSPTGSLFIRDDGTLALPPGASGGEANTLVLQSGAAGTSLVGSKVGVTLGVKGVTGTSSRILVTSNSTDVLVDAVIGTTAGTVASGDVAIDLAQHLIASQAAGDQFISNGATGLKRVAKGSSGQVWVQGATDPSWVTLAAGNLPTVDVPHGGTGLTTATLGDLHYATGTNVLGALAIGATDNVLSVEGGVPVWQALTATQLPTTTAAKGGTGQTSYTTGDLPYASGASAISKLGIGATGTILTVAAGLPSWSSTLVASRVIAAPSTQTGATITVTTANDTIRCDPSANAQTANLYTCAANAGRSVTFKYIASATGTNAVSVTPNGTDTIDNLFVPWILRSQGEYVTLSVNAAATGWDVLDASYSVVPVALGNSGTALAVPATPYSTYFTTTATGNCTYTVTGIARGQVIELAIDTGAGGFTAAFLAPGRVLKPAGSVTPALTTTASKRDRFFFRDDGTTVWYSSGQGY